MNLDGGYGGPQDRTVLPTPADVVADLADTGLVVQRSDVMKRAVDVGAEVHHARDCLVVATRPDATSERRETARPAPPDDVPPVTNAPTATRDAALVGAGADGPGSPTPSSW